VNQSNSDLTSKNPTESRRDIVAILGIGGAGVKILSKIIAAGAEDFIKTGIVDFDNASLDSFDGPNKISSGSQWTTKGCGGDIIVGERMMASARGKICDFAKGASCLIGVCGMGGGTGTSGAHIIARVAKGLGIPSIFVLSMPFSFEGHQKIQLADKGLENLLQDADVIIPIHNDILYSTMPAETPFEEAFEKADSELASAILCLAEIVTAEKYLSGTFTDFKKMLGRKKTACSLGSGFAQKNEGPDYCHVAVERLMDSPLLGGITEIKKTDAAAVILSGGKDLSIGAMKKTFEKIRGLFPETVDMTCSVTGSDKITGKIRITVLAAKYEQSLIQPNFDKEKNMVFEKLKEPASYTQEELPLMTLKKGIFTNTSDNYFDNQDLDVPTFQRKNISIDMGK
jgi:cell division protein FtsZ